MKSQPPLLENKYPKAFGGKARSRRRDRTLRPLHSRKTIHLMIKSSRARGGWSFRRHQNWIAPFIEKTSAKWGVRIFSMANVGNHLHFQLQIHNRHNYRAWIRAVCAGIAVHVAGHRALQRLKAQALTFWDYRPFTRVVEGLKGYLALRDYIQINRLEGSGVARETAEMWVKSGALRLNSG